MANRRKAPEAKKSTRSRRPPPLQQGVLDEAIARLSLRDVTMKPLFGGLCYYAAGKPFAILLGASLALKLPAMQLRQACAQGDGEVFHPGGGDFTMREYLDLSPEALTDEERIDTHVQASYRFIAGQGPAEEELNWGDLLQGRAELYQQAKQRKG
jgi:TfoX/Sxy family transcriptional regulator of competence genes